MTTSPRAARRGLVQWAAVWAVALGLTVAGASLNRFGVPLLTTEAPDFLFGSLCAWLVFFWCGRLYGLAAAVGVALLGDAWTTPWTLATATGAGLLVLEAWGVTALATRLGSVVMGAVVFWLFAGAPALFVGQWLVAGVPGELVALALVVRVFNALVNASVAEVLVRVVAVPHALHRAELAASTTLEHYIVRRIVPVVIVPVLVIGLFHTRTQYDTTLDQSRLEALAVSDAVVSALGRDVPLDNGQLRALLVRARTDPEHLVTLADRAGVVIVSLDPALRPGMFLPAAATRGDGRRQASAAAGWYGAEQEVPVSGWRVRVALPASALHGRMVHATAGVLALAAGLLAGLYLVVLAVARHIASPLATLRQTTATMAAGRFERPAAPLAASPIRELRSISTDLRQLRTALHSYDRMRRAREQETEARLRHTFEQAAVGLAHVSLQGICLRVNMRLCEILGHAADDLIGRGIETVLQAEDCARVDELLGRVITGQEAIGRIELALLGADGRTHWTQFTLSLGRDAAGEPAYLILVLEDLAGRRALEEQLRRSQKLESVGRLAGGVAHDFNNLLTAIIGYSDFLQDALGPQHQHQHDVEQIRDAARRAANLTRQLLAFARQQVLERRVLSVNELTGRMHRLLERLIGEHIDLQLELDPGLQNVNADGGQLEQVVLNLAVNARDAMPGGGVLRVTTANVRLDGAGGPPESLPPGDYVQITVSDSGLGMTEEVRARAFEPFFTTKGSERGTGLGLATCYGIVKQLGGEIDVESTPGRGTTFRMLLPATREPIQLDVQPEISSRPGGSERVMLVEDEQTVSRIAARTLRQQGYEVVEAMSGAQALERLRGLRGRVDVLVTDLVMPQMGGRELARHARLLNPDIRIVFVSGYLGEATAELDLRETGAVFLQKPFRPRALVQTVRAVLDTVQEPQMAVRA